MSNAWKRVFLGLVAIGTAAAAVFEFARSGFGVVTAVGVGAATANWLWAEFNYQSEIISHRETIKERSPTQNDVRVTRELLGLHAGLLRKILKDADLWDFLPSDNYTQLGELYNRVERKLIFFHDFELNK